MSFRFERRAWAIALGLLAWAGMVLFTWLSQERSESHDLALAVGASAFVIYLLEIGYLVYVRSYSKAQPASGGDEKRGILRVMGPWLATVAILGAFGLVVGLGFPSLTESFPGQVFVNTVVFAGVATGIVRTVTGPFSGQGHRASSAHSGASSTPEPPPFWKVALRLVAWQVGALVVAVAFFGPVMLLQKGFERWIDIPACRRVCESRGFRFRSFVTTKTTYACTCAGAGGPHVFHERAYVGGGHSWLAAVGDWLFRAGTSMALAIGWPIVLIGLFVLTRRKSRG